MLAQRASISRTTLVKIERSDPGVSLGNHAGVLFALGLVDGLAPDVTTSAVPAPSE